MCRTGISHHIKELINPCSLFFQVPVEVAWGEREKNWEGGAGLWGIALLPLEASIFVLFLCAQREEVKELEKEQGNGKREQMARETERE
jgi:hypothetical protein